MRLLALLSAVSMCAAGSVIYDGRAPLTLTQADLDASRGPYLTAVKGQNQSASHYSTLLGSKRLPTALWNRPGKPIEQAVAVSIDSTSVFVPGGGAPQLGFRRTELIAQVNGSSSVLDPLIESPGLTSVFHFSIKMDESRPLNYSHEYQIVFIEPNDGSHVFEVQLGSPFTIPTGKLPSADAQSFKIRDHALNILFETAFVPSKWHNFAVTVDWSKLTLAVAYSVDGAQLKDVSGTKANSGVTAGALGDFHFGVLKLPIADPSDTAAHQGDVVHFGIQEAKSEALLYSGVFVETL